MSKTLSPGLRAKLAGLGLNPARVGRAAADAGGGNGSTTVEDVQVPDTPAGFEEQLNDPKAMKALFSKPGAFAEWVRGYAKVVLDKDQEIATQVREQTERVLASWLKEQRDGEGVVPINLNVDGGNLATQVTRTADARMGLHNPRAMGAVLDKDFSGPSASADYFQLIWHNANRDAQAQARLKNIRNSFSSTVPSEGGFLIPETLRSELLRVSLETSVVRPRARVIPMETLRVPFPAIDDTSHTSSVYGGIVGYWTEEGAALTASQASFGRIVLDAKKLTAYTEIPNELISDSISSFQAFIDQIFPEALGFYEDLAFLTGTGVGEPLGFLNGTAKIEVTRDTADEIHFADIVAMYSRMLPSSLSRAVWVASIDTFPQLAQLKMTFGTDGIASPALWLNNGQVIGGPPMTLMGRPVIFSEKVPKLTEPGALSFVDFGFYLIGDRQVMSAMSSPHFKFQNDQTAYRIIQRVDGRPWLNSAITPQNNGDTLSPIVTVGT
jgi:HK97 family phage major capsid protein